MPTRDVRVAATGNFLHSAPLFGAQSVLGEYRVTAQRVDAMAHALGQSISVGEKLRLRRQHLAGRVTIAADIVFPQPNELRRVSDLEVGGLELSGILRVGVQEAGDLMMREGRVGMAQGLQSDRRVGDDLFAVRQGDALLFGDAVGEEARQVWGGLAQLVEANLAAGDQARVAGPGRNGDRCARLRPASTKCSFVTSAQPRRHCSSSWVSFQPRFFGPNPSEVSVRVVSNIWACGLCGLSRCTPMSATMPLATNSRLTKSRSSATCSLLVSSPASPTSISRAS